MANRPWRTSMGLVAVLLWSAVIGFPVLTFHLSIGLDVGQHIHAGVLFVASQVLVFWLAARSVPRTRPPALQNQPPRFGASVEHQIWQAELVPTANHSQVTTVARSPVQTNPFQQPSDRETAKLLVSNYLGSSRVRIVSVEPGGFQRKLLPGQELEITAVARGIAPRFCLVESDLATQVFVEGVGVEILVGPQDKDGIEVPVAGPARQTGSML